MAHLHKGVHHGVLEDDERGDEAAPPLRHHSDHAGDVGVPAGHGGRHRGLGVTQADTHQSTLERTQVIRSVSAVANVVPIGVRGGGGEGFRV